MSTQVTPWWEVLKLRDEIAHSSGSIDDVQMSLFQAVYGTVTDRPAYADAAYYGEITHPSPLFTDLMAKVAVRLGGGDNYTRARALWRLDQAMGGGKSHGLIGLWHLAAHPAVLAGTDTGREAFAKATAILDGPPAADLGNPQVVVLACDNMTAGKGVAAYDGPAQTLYERFLWRLFGGDNALYLRYKDYNGDKSKIVEALTAIGRPVLILVDEIMDYIRQLSDTDNADLAVRDMAFLRALLDSVNDVRNVAAVVVMIASEKDNMDLDAAGQRRRDELDDLLIRNGETATINDNTDFAAILQRRLFEGTAPAEVLAATARTFTARMTGPWRDKVFNAVPATATAGVRRRGRALLSLPPPADGARRAGVGQTRRIPDCSVNHQGLRRDSICAAQAREIRCVDAAARWPRGPPALRPGSARGGHRIGADCRHAYAGELPADCQCGHRRGR